MRIKILYLVIISVFIFSCDKDDSLEFEGVDEMFDVSYGSHAQQNMDVYLPKNRNAETPLIIVMHGGAFILGDKADIRSAMPLLYQKNYAVVNLNYRLVDTAGIFRNPMVHQPSAVTIASQLDDIALAINFIKTKATEWNISATKWAITGHSAGGTLSLLYGFGKNNDGQIKVIGNWAGATTLTFNDASEFDTVDPRYKELFYRIVGAEVRNENKLAFMAVSPYWVANNQTSVKPTINIKPEDNRVGELPDYSVNEYTSFINLLNSKNVINKYVLVADATHSFQEPGKWELVANETDAFLKTNF